MKTIANENQVLMKFYVAVLYQWHPYFPSNLNNISEELKSQIIKDSTSVKTLLLSSTASSDLIEFAEYKFGFKIKGEDYKERLLNNFLDSYSREIVGIDFRDLQKVENNIVFQKSQEQKEYNEKDSGYFGAVSMDNDQIYMIDAPQGTWKIEIYENLQDEFIEYTVRKKFNLEISQEPILTIELGPEIDCFNNSKNKELTLYYEGNNLYDELSDVELSDVDYRALCQEITDQKVFYIVQTPNKLTSVNISLTSWNRAEVPHRNKKYWNVTNNHFKGTVDNDSNIFTTKYNNSLVDTASMILLGNQKIDIDKTPILKETIKRCEKNENFFKKEIIYQTGDIVIYKTSEYESLIDENLGNDPDGSYYWKKLEAIQEKENKVFKEIFNSETTYNKGDIVIYEGYRYKSIIDDNLGKIPESNTTEFWTKLMVISELEKEILSWPWKNDKSYKKNDIIIFNGIKYRSLSDNNKNNLPNVSLYWKKLRDLNIQEQYNISTSFRKDLVYNLNDIVTFKGAEYKSLIDGNIFDDPDISCFWTKIDKTGSSIIDRLEKNKKYESILVMSDNGNVYPNGNLSAKIIDDIERTWYKTFILEEQLGFLFSHLLIDGTYLLSKEDLKNNLTEKEIGIFDFNLDQRGLKKKNKETMKLDFKTFEFIFKKTIPIINYIFNIKEDYYHNGGKSYIYKNYLPEGFSLKLNGKLLDSNPGTLAMDPGSKYELEAICDNTYYTLESQPKFNGIVDKNKIDLNFTIKSREYLCIFKNYHEYGIVVNGDSSKICYYKQTINFEFSFENDEDTLLNWEMEKCLIINGRALSYWKNGEYKIRLLGGGNISEEKRNNYILTIENITQDFNIVFKI